MRWRRKKAPEQPIEQPAPDQQQADQQAADQDAGQVLADLQRVVDRFGWAVLHGGGGSPGDPRWSHTVGLTAFGHPEVIVMGLPFPAGEKYLNLVGEAVRGGARFGPGAATTGLTDADSPVVFLAVEDTARLAVAEQFYGSIEVLQLVWPDSTGRLPWQEGHRNPPEAQPLLGPLPGAEPTGD
ncbi:MULTISPECIES: DUF4262 domain-containing protein [unclassified Modestobacter]|uniref:DUF4262 domain-containing protein n=1 Tax=unclassified Modestobacter TaxID=2643866 RepID=UPI0022AB1997|nr:MULTISPECIES: DUF4262 domain-containing protein [unclassified Modestobacter]MCZ2824108.1 DUF4262 domain-containing protein [Modestobacter sp. VKM Ac-2981]MCZ2852353.1 DUF4262 domain-containing protein [Modestobacter sp. VKM Ac-2982]